MTKLIILAALLFTSCAIEGPECSNATFSLTAWIGETGLIRISYESEVKGYELLVGCPEQQGYEPETWQILDRNENKTWADWAITRECSPEYIMVRSLDGRIEKTIRL